MNGNIVIFTRDDIDLIASFAASSLDRSPRKNWVERAGGLPGYIRRIAEDIHQERGKTISQAIAIAVSRVKKWATGVGASKDTQAKAAKALAEWEKLKGKSHAKAAANKVAASRTDDEVLCLTDYNMDDIRSAFNSRTNQLRKDWRQANPHASYDDPSAPPYLYVKEVWNTFLIVHTEYGRDADLYKVPYTVDDSGEVSFGDSIEVRTEYVAVDPESDLGDTEPAGETDGDQAVDDALKKIMAMSGSPTAVDKILRLGAPTSSVAALASRAGSVTALDKIVGLTRAK